MALAALAPPNHLLDCKLMGFARLPPLASSIPMGISLLVLVKGGDVPELNKVLVLYAHPSQHHSEINRHLFDVACDMEYVTAVDLYAEYPNFRIDVNKEHDRLRSHEIIIFLFPIYWYSTPAILKEWQDLVLDYGFAYDARRSALAGKTFFCAVSAGGSKTAYEHQGAVHFSLQELFRPLEQMALLMGMKYLPPFVLFDSRTAVKEKRLEVHLEQFYSLLKACIKGELSAEKVVNLTILSDGASSGKKVSL